MDEQTASTRRFPGSPRRRRWSSPLTRASDRVQAVSRAVTALLLLATMPLAVVVAMAVHGQVGRIAAAEQAARSLVPATVLADPAPGQPPAGGSGDTPYAAGAATDTALAGWHGPDGGYRQAPVAVPVGARAGNVVRIWVDRAGQPVPAPTADGDVAADTIAAVVLTVSAVAGTALLGHLGVALLLERSRMRRWARGWATVEPLWSAGSR